MDTGSQATSQYIAMLDNSVVVITVNNGMLLTNKKHNSNRDIQTNNEYSVACTATYLLLSYLIWQEGK